MKSCFQAFCSYSLCQLIHSCFFFLNCKMKCNWLTDAPIPLSPVSIQYLNLGFRHLLMRSIDTTETTANLKLLKL